MNTVHQLRKNSACEKKQLIEIKIINLIREPRTSYFTGFSGKIAISNLD